MKYIMTRERERERERERLNIKGRMHPREHSRLYPD
jgi:hypothetical protein